MNAVACFLCWTLAVPSPGDAYRLPPLSELRAGRLFNSRYRRHLEWRLEWEYHTAAGPHLRAALAEANELYRVWDSAEGAHPDFVCSADAKAAYLRALRLWMGRDAWNQMTLPPPAPYWRFSELR